MKKKYTIVYPECVVTRFPRVFVPKYKHVETNNLKDAIRDEFGSDVYFVFEGWIEETKD